MPRLTSLAAYEDQAGNVVEYGGSAAVKADIQFKGGNNRLAVADSANLAEIKATFWGDNGVVRIGATTMKRSPMRFEMKIGHESTIVVGQNVGTDAKVLVCAVEGADVTLGDDIMFAAGIEVRTDDTHAIYDSVTGERINVAQSITIGEHVWIAKHAVIMGGVSVGSGSVIGFRSIVTRSLPNNCVAVGAPARVVRRNVVWERPELASKRPGERFAPEQGRSLQYWNETVDLAD